MVELAGVGVLFAFALIVIAMTMCFVQIYSGLRRG